MKLGALLYLAFEIGALFILGGIFYLFQRRKYIRQHREITCNFMNRVKDAGHLNCNSLTPKQFELSFIDKYKKEKNLDSYSSELQEIYSEYIDYIEGISGPIL